MQLEAQEREADERELIVQVAVYISENPCDWNNKGKRNVGCIQVQKRSVFPPEAVRKFTHA